MEVQALRISWEEGVQVVWVSGAELSGKEVVLKQPGILGWEPKCLEEVELGPKLARVASEVLA